MPTCIIHEHTQITILNTFFTSAILITRLNKSHTWLAGTILTLDYTILLAEEYMPFWLCKTTYIHCVNSQKIVLSIMLILSKCSFSVLTVGHCVLDTVCCFLGSLDIYTYCQKHRHSNLLEVSHIGLPCSNLSVGTMQPYILANSSNLETRDKMCIPNWKIDSHSQFSCSLEQDDAILDAR